MTIATVLAAGLLPVIPQPTQWTPSEGECDIATASVSVAVCTDSGLGEEGYTMKIAPGGIKIVAGGETGRVWAWQTIAQLKAAGAKAPCGYFPAAAGSAKVTRTLPLTSTCLKSGEATKLSPVITVPPRTKRTPWLPNSFCLALSQTK